MWIRNNIFQKQLLLFFVTTYRFYRCIDRIGCITKNCTQTFA